MRRYALLIGCNKGKDLSPLQAAQHDAKRVHAMLCRHSSWQDDHITTLIGGITRRDIDSAIQGITQQIVPNDFVFVYYAGHASKHGADYFFNLPDELYEIKGLLNAFVSTELQIRSLLIIDACFSGQAAANAFKSFFHKLIPSLPESHTFQSSMARAVITASAADQQARERSSGGVMTTAFLRAAEHGGDADLTATEKGTATINSIATYIDQQLEKRGDQKPLPLVYAGGFAVKTLLEWRLRMGGERDFDRKRFLMLAEDTHMWSSTDSSPRELIAVAWGVEPPKNERPKIALRFEGEPVKVYDLLQEERRLVEVHELPCTSTQHGIKLSPSGHYAAILTEQGTLTTSHAPWTKEATREIGIQPGSFLVTSHGILITRSATQGVLEAWSLASARDEPLARSSSVGPRASNQLCALPDGSAIVSGSLEPGQAFKWILPDFSALANANGVGLIDASMILPEPVSPFGRPFGLAINVAVNPRGDKLAVAFGGQSSHVRVWNSVDLSKPMTVIQFPDYKSLVTRLEFSKDGSYLASACADGSVYITTIGENSTSVKIRSEDGDSVTAIAFSPEGQDPALIVGTFSGMVMVYSLSNRAAKPLENSGRGEVFELLLLSNANHPMQGLVATRHGLEYWDISL